MGEFSPSGAGSVVPALSSGPAAAPLSRLRKPRPFWFRVHTWAGLKLSILLFFVFTTGTLAVFSHEMDWLLNPEMRASGDGSGVSLGGQVAAARAAYPDWTIASFATPKDPWWNSQITAMTPNGTRKRIWVDPGTGDVTGHTGFANLQVFFRRTHRHLMLPNQIGIPLVSSLSLVLTATLISSLVIYKKWWRGFLRAPRTRNSRTLWGDLHRLGGVWSLWFVIVMILTSYFYLAESLGARGSLPPLAQASWTDDPPALSAQHIDDGIAAAKAVFPGYEVRRIILPRREGSPLLLEGDGDAVLVRIRANRVALDPVDGTVLSVQRGEDLAAWQRISEAADPLHFGTFGGMWTKALYFLFGLVLTGLSGSGVYIYGARLAKRNP